MKAVRFHEPGGTEVLVYEDAPDPVISDDEVLIRVRACSLNRVDIWVRTGAYKVSLPHILGSEYSGEVARIGGNVKGISVGDRVLIYPGLTDNTCRWCLAGEDSICENFGIVGVASDGGYAECAKVPKENVFPIPEGISFEEASAVSVVFLTAWHMLVTRAGLKAGESVLIQAAGSGIGSAAVQIAKLAGATVIATAGSDAKLQKAKEFGADHIINYTERNFAEEVLGITEGRGVDVVFEHTGAETFPGSLMSMSKNGRLVVSGATTGADAQINIRQIYNRQLSIIGSMLGNRAELVEILRLVGERKLIPVIDRVMPLADAKEAHELLMDRKQFGKIVLRT